MNISISKNAQTKIHRKVPKYVINDFLSWAIKTQNDETNYRFYNSLSLDVASYIFLYFLITNASYKEIEQEIGVPHNNLKQILGLCRKLWCNWAEEKVVVGTYKQRRSRRSQFKLTNMFDYATLIADSADFPTIKRHNRKTKSVHHSYKLYQHGVRVTFIIDFSKRFVMVLGPDKPKTYDSRIIGKRRTLIKNKLKKKDRIIADNHYGSVSDYFRKPRFITRYADTKKNIQDECKQYFNSQHKVERAKIENAISHLGNRFAVLRYSYRRKRSFPIYQFAKIAAAVSNCIIENKK